MHTKSPENIIIMIFGRFFKSNSKRSSTVKKNIIWGAIIKITSILVSFMLVPMTINYVSSELYGIWLTLSSIIAWLGFFDIGFGLGLRNRLTTALAHGDLNLGKKYVSTTYFVLSLIFIPVALISLICVKYVNWCSMLNISENYQEVLVSSSRIIVLSFCINIILKLIQNVCQAYQMTALSAALDTIGGVISLIGIYILTVTTFPNLNLLAMVFCITPLVVFLIASFVLYTTKFECVAPSLDCIQIKYARDIFSLGSSFFLIQIVYIVLFQTTNFIISHYCGPEQVTVYNISYRYLNCALMAFNIIMAPIWSAFNDANAKNDYHWMNSIYRKLCMFNMIIIFGIAFLVLISPIVIKIWIGDKVSVPISITIMIGVYMSVLSISNMSATILNGLGIIKLQLLQAVGQGILFISMVLFLAEKYGIVGVLISLIITIVFSASILTIQVNKVLNKKAYGIWAK